MTHRVRLIAAAAAALGLVAGSCGTDPQPDPPAPSAAVEVPADIDAAQDSAEPAAPPASPTTAAPVGGPEPEAVVTAPESEPTTTTLPEPAPEPEPEPVQAAAAGLAVDPVTVSEGLNSFTLEGSGFDPDLEIWTLLCPLASGLTEDTPQEELAAAMAAATAADCDLTTTQKATIDAEGSFTMTRDAVVAASFMWVASDTDQTQVAAVAVFMQAPEPEPEPTPTSVPVSSGDGIADRALAFLAGELGAPESEITLTRTQTAAWPDTSLGCPKEGYAYAQVLTPGYRFTFSHGTTSHDVHTDEQGTSFVRPVGCHNPTEPEPTTTTLPEPEPTTTTLPEPEPTTTTLPEPEPTTTTLPEPESVQAAAASLTVEPVTVPEGLNTFTLEGSGLDPDLEIWTLLCPLASGFTEDTPQEELAAAMAAVTAADCDLTTTQKATIDAEGSFTMTRDAIVMANFMWVASDADQTQVAAVAVFMEAPEPAGAWVEPYAGYVPEVHPDTPPTAWERGDFEPGVRPFETPRTTGPDRAQVAGWIDWMGGTGDSYTQWLMFNMKWALDYLGADPDCVISQYYDRVTTSNEVTGPGQSEPNYLRDLYGWSNCATVIDPFIPGVALPEDRENDIGLRLSDTPGITLAERC